MTARLKHDYRIGYGALPHDVGEAPAFRWWCHTVPPSTPWRDEGEAKTREAAVSLARDAEARMRAEVIG